MQVISEVHASALAALERATTLEELMGLRDRLGFAALFITHDLSLLVEFADDDIFGQL